MRKKIVFAAIFAVSVLIMTLVANLRVNPQTGFDLLRENVEALAQGEAYEYPDGYPYYKKCGVAIGNHRTCKVEVIVCQGGGKGCNSKKCPQHN